MPCRLLHRRNVQRKGLQRRAVCAVQGLMPGRLLHDQVSSRPTALLRQHTCCFASVLMTFYPCAVSATAPGTRTAQYALRATRRALRTSTCLALAWGHPSRTPAIASTARSRAALQASTCARGATEPRAATQRRVPTALSRAAREACMLTRRARATASPMPPRARRARCTRAHLATTFPSVTGPARSSRHACHAPSAPARR
jgi:hypothetical protein